MPLTKVTTAITAATPITTPSKVSAERSLFAHNDRNAILMASVMFMAQGASVKSRAPGHLTSPAGSLSGSQFSSTALGSWDFASRNSGCGIYRASVSWGVEAMDGWASRPSVGWPGGDARRSIPWHHILPEATRIESFTDTNATSNASMVQIAADPRPPWKIGGGTGGMDIASCGV